jgi:hypothetical protein
MASALNRAACRDSNVVVLVQSAIEQALAADSQSAGLFVKLRGRAAQAQRYALAC